MLPAVGLRRPIFIYGKNHVGGAEYLFLRRAECAARLGLEPVIITVPGPMDERFRRAAKVIHVAPRILSRPAFTPAMAAAAADDMAALLGFVPSHIEATSVVDAYFASLLATRLPDTDFSLLIIRPGTALMRAWPGRGEVFSAPTAFFRALRGRRDSGMLGRLAATGRVLSVNQACADDAARLAGLVDMPVILAPVILPAPQAVTTPLTGEPYLLSVSRLDGKMKSYVEGLIGAFAELRRAHPGLRLKIVGEGPGLPSARRKAMEAGVADATEFLGTLPSSALAPLYAGAKAFVGMGTAACEAAMHGAPVVLALAYQAEGASPGYYGQPGVQGFGEDVPGQARMPLLDLLGPVLADGSLRSAIAERGRRQALADHHPDAAMVAMRSLLSRPPVKPVVAPWPVPRYFRLLGNLLSGVGSCRPLARWA